LGFIGGTPEKPAPITDREANQILRRVEEGADKPRPKVLFEPGEVVRVVDARGAGLLASRESVTGDFLVGAHAPMGSAKRGRAVPGPAAKCVGSRGNR